MKKSDILIIESLFIRFDDLKLDQQTGEKNMGLPKFETMNKQERDVIYAKWRNGYWLLVLLKEMVDKAKQAYGSFNVSGFQEDNRFDKKLFEQLVPAKALLPALEKNIKYYEKKLTTYEKKWDKAVLRIIPSEMLKARDDLLKVLKKNVKKECIGKFEFIFKYDYGAFQFEGRFKFGDKIARFSQKYVFNKDRKKWEDYSKYGWGSEFKIGNNSFYAKALDGKDWGEEAIAYMLTNEDMKNCLKDNLRKKAEAKLKIANKNLEEMKRLAKGVRMELYSADVQKGKAVLQFETRYPLNWEYDRDKQSKKEWEEEGEIYMRQDKIKLHKVFPKSKYDVSEGGLGEKGHASFYVTMKK